ncbi:MAG TPA: 2Fe-2S iron-sulfur cluster binding domain-containing protein [Cellvibrionaceae bacterium]|nr:2Fe-2S iron-sulfur cluster binding domain-containing protein [Cellvibrionaceae bacterium]
MVDPHQLTQQRQNSRRYLEQNLPLAGALQAYFTHYFLLEPPMATVYFSSPIMHKNTKLEAVAGKRTTLLGFAKEHKIPIPHECEDGRCGSCLIKVTHLDGERVKGMALTDRERVVLKSLGKLPAREEERANVNDIPPTYRLACQTIITDEDILVEFTGEPGGAQ